MPLPSFILATLLASSPNVDRPHGVHAHGHAELKLALEGDTLHLELQAPGMGIVGFEHAPREVAQEAAIADALAYLNSGAWLALPGSAACILESADFHTHGHEHAKHPHHDPHTDFHGTLTWRCANPATLTSLAIDLGQRYPAIDRLTVDSVSARGQGRVTLPGASGNVPLPR